jgi:hypothetical protein
MVAAEQFRTGGPLVTKLKLSAIEDGTPVKLTLELLAHVHRDLVGYGQAMAATPGGRAIDPVRLIAPMLSRFMPFDRAFSRGRNARGEA